MVEAVSLGIAVLAVIIAIIAIILAFVIPGPAGPQGIQGPQGIPGISGGMEGLNYSGFKTVETGSNIQFIPGMFYNISETTSSTLLGPSDSLKAGDSITFSNKTTDFPSYIMIGKENGGYCTLESEGPLEEIGLIGNITTTMIVTGNTCDDGTGAEVYFYDSTS